MQRGTLFILHTGPYTEFLEGKQGRKRPLDTPERKIERESNK